MGSKRKIPIFLIVLIMLTSTATFQPATLKAQTSAPTIESQHVYSSQIMESSNLIQTSDDGYVFMDLGWGTSSHFKPSTIFKVDSFGNIQWNKTIEVFTGSKIIQTNDNGYEMTGWWNAYNGWYGSTYYNLPLTSTLITTDSEGNIQRVQNYTQPKTFLT